MWRALSVCEGDVVCYLDGDTGNFGEHFACGTLGPLLLEPGVQYVKAFFRRPFRAGGPEDGGRVTELTARPLLRRFWPELAALRQPLAGEMAAPRALLEPAAVLRRLRGRDGAAARRAPRGRPARARAGGSRRAPERAPAAAGAGPMADEVLAAAAVRLQRDGRLAGGGKRRPGRAPADGAGAAGAAA